MTNARASLDEDDALKAPRTRTRTTAQVREPVRANARGNVVVLGHNGEQLSRSVDDDHGDQFHVPNELVPKGWSYQWNTVHIYGNQEVVLRHMNKMRSQGWRPVPAGRHPGRWTSLGHTGDIVVEGSRLEERPIELTEEAQQEDQRKAAQQMRDRDQALMGGKASVRNLPTGFDMSNRYRGTGGNLRMSIDPALDVPAPQHELAGSDE